jgi:glutamate decarboxylase
MVHLAAIPTNKELTAPTLAGVKHEGFDEPEDFIGSVYGSRYAACDLPKYEMPEREMPKEVAYRMIK